MSRSQELWGALRSQLHETQRDWVAVAGSLAMICACEGVSTQAVDYMLDALREEPDLEVWLATQMRLLARGTALAGQRRLSRAFDEMQASLTLELARLHLHEMMSVWFGDIEAQDANVTYSHHPNATLAGPDLEEARRLFGLVFLERAYCAQVNLGNFFPREVTLSYGLGDHADISYQYVGPFSRGAFPNIHFEIDGATVYQQVMDEIETLSWAPLDTLRLRLKTPWGREKLLGFLWLIAECQRCEYSSGAQEVAFLRDQLTYQGIPWEDGLAGL